MSESRVNNSRILPNTMQGAGTRVPRKRRLRVPSVADRQVNGAQALTHQPSDLIRICCQEELESLISWKVVHKSQPAVTRKSDPPKD